MSVNTSKEKIEEILTRGVEEVLDRENLEKKLKNGNVLRVKLGIDPTSPNIHLGRAVTLFKLRDFQQLGHKVVFIIGDFTGLVGDTSDKNSERPMLSEQTVKDNMASYVSQAAKILEIDKCEVVYNSSWLSKLNFLDIGELADVFSLNNFISRENIKLRVDAGKRVSLREILYPLMQGYDSVSVKADVELGGTDQWFNLLAGRDLQKHFGQEPQDVIINPILEGLDGRKMSSSWGNTINISDSAREMFGKVMSISDDLILRYFELATRVSVEKIEEIKKTISTGGNPRDAKIELAFEIVKFFHNEKMAEEEKIYFEETFSKKITPKDIEEIKLMVGENLSAKLLEAGIITSGGEWRRLISAGAVETESAEKISEINYFPKEDTVLKIGKKRFVKIILSKYN